MNIDFCKCYLSSVVKEYYYNKEEFMNYNLELDSVELDILKEYINNHEKYVVTYNPDTGELIGNKTAFENIKNKIEINEQDFIKYIRKLYFNGYLSSDFKMEYTYNHIIEAINYFCTELSVGEREGIYESIVKPLVIENLKKATVNNIDFDNLDITIPSELIIDYSKRDKIEIKFENFIRNGIEANK